MQTTLQARTLEVRNPSHLTIITKVWLDKYPEHKDTVGHLYDIRGDRPVDQGFVSQVKAYGSIHDPVKIVKIAGVGDVVVNGRQRVRAAMQLGYEAVEVFVEDADKDEQVLLEISSNLARSDNTPRETYNMCQQALIAGVSKESLQRILNISDIGLRNIFIVGEMPDFVHKAIEGSAISTTAALQLQSFGKKAGVAGRVKTYDKDAQAKMKEALVAMKSEGKLSANGKKVSVKQARDSATKGEMIDSLSKAEWVLLIEDENTPDNYKAVISAFVGTISWQKARQIGDGNLDWLRRIVKPKAEKKVTTKKGTKKAEVVETTVSSDEWGLDEMFDE